MLTITIINVIVGSSNSADWQNKLTGSNVTTIGYHENSYGDNFFLFIYG